jgi:predicted GNAT family acetyltransferase
MEHIIEETCSMENHGKYHGNIIEDICSMENHGKYWAWMKFSRNLAISNTWQFENSSMRSREDQLIQNHRRGQNSTSLNTNDDINGDYY